MRIRIAASLLVLLIVPSIAAAESPQRILFIGNSYTAGIRSTLVAFVKKSPHRKVDLEFITPGGRDLHFHASQTETIKRIREGKWDIVVLQDQSQTPAALRDRFLNASKRLHEIIAKSGATTVYYETWGRRDGDKQNKEQFPTYEKMQDALSSAYQNAAERDEAILVPVGQAWRRVRKEQPQLGRELYRGDGSHPSASGAYVATICFYSRLLDADPEKVKYVGNLKPAIADKLRAAAVEVLKTPQ